MAQGPLDGVRVLEFAGLGPAPFCAMLLCDMGAEVVRIDRPGAADGAADAVLLRGRRRVTLDLKAPADAAVALDLAERADLLIEGLRPGVMERLGLGPAEAHGRNRALVYGRMTGWGQTGPLAHRAGHDINYIALSGALHAVGAHERPAVPLNLVGDFGGGALYLAMGLLAALHHARRTGEGQVVDAAMTDGAASLMAMTYGLHAQGLWEDRRGANLLDGAAPFYDVYRCSDGGFIAVGAIEPQFYTALLRRLKLDDADALARQFDRADWPGRKLQLAARFATLARDTWFGILNEVDACTAPVLSLAEAPLHPHNVARGTFVEVGGLVQPAPAPRFSATPSAVQGPPTSAGADTDAVLADWGLFPRGRSSELT